MRVCIIGWYGTETIGDRAILDGIFQILGKIDNALDVRLGSIYPILTERTLLQDGEIFKAGVPGINISIFDSRNKKELIKNIKDCDYCIMGGGPIMDIKELPIVLFAFKNAKKNNKKTVIFGCGLGPLIQKRSLIFTKGIFTYSDLIIFRDSKAIITSRELFGEKFVKKTFFLPDPAISSVGHFLKLQIKSTSENKHLVINLRDYAISGIKEDYKLSINDFINLLNKASTLYEKIILIPMHTFFIGIDDRKFLTEIAFQVNKSNVIVRHKPLNIYDTYSLFFNAEACIGMRYHSIVFQTLLNGNNYIFDYTNKKTGKIASFLNDMDTDDFYHNRYINLSDPVKKLDIESVFNVLKKNKYFKYSGKIYEDTLNSYIGLLKREVF